MPNYRRFKTNAVCYFFTVVTHQCQPILCDEHLRTVLREAIHETRKTIPFRIDAWVLMPDHFHCVLTFEQKNSDFSQLWGRVKRHVSCKCKQYTSHLARSKSQIKRREIGLWQRRFWEHQIRDQNDFELHIDYVHNNPVKHGYCQNPNQWLWSTIHRFQ